MGLRCSLFGHAFEDPVTERDRETRGAEVLISVREVRRCSRCGAEQVIAENTEVRHLGTNERATKGGTADSEPEASEPMAPEGEDEAPTQSETDPSVEDTESEPAVEDPDPEPPAAEDISQFVDSAEEPAESEPTGQDEDVEILDESDESDETAPAEASADQTEPDARHADSETEQPDVEATEPSPDEPGDTESGGEVLTEDDTASGQEPPVEAGATAGPEADDDDEEDEEPVTDDAIIMDNDAGEDERRSDIGRRELAGTGNMFDPSAPDRDVGSSTDSPDTELTDYYESTDESAIEEPGAEPQADPDAAESEPTPWPGEEDEQSGRDDPGFQFGPDMQQDEEIDEAPGFKTEGSIDVEGGADDTPPRTVICPACGYETRAIGSSLRAGDICPECHNGYLAERR